MFSLHSFAHGCAWLFWLGSIVHWTRSRGINNGIIMLIFFPLRERTYIFRHNKIHHKSSVCSKTLYFPAHNNISITDPIPSRGPWTTSWTRSMDHHGPPHGPGPWTTPNFQKEIVLGSISAALSCLVHPPREETAERVSSKACLWRKFIIKILAALLVVRNIIWWQSLAGSHDAYGS